MAVTKTYRLPKAMRVGCIAVALGFSGLAVGAALGSDSAATALVAVVACAAGAFFFVVAAARLRVTLGDRLEIHRLFRYESIRWSDIAAVEPGRSGIVITTKDGRQHVASAVQRANWTSRRTRADDVAAEIRLYARRRH